MPSVPQNEIDAMTFDEAIPRLASKEFMISEEQAILETVQLVV